jgi:adenine-specific DNA-methyltransferase
VVSRLARQNGYRVIANDWEPYSHALNHAILACVDAPAFKELGGYQKAIDYLNRLPEVKGWVTHNLCPRNDDVYDPARDRLFLNAVMACVLMQFVSRLPHGKRRCNQ